MKRLVFAALSIVTAMACGSCGSSGSKGTAAPVVVSLANTFAFVEAGGGAVTINANVSGAGGGQGVSWTLSIANTSCSPACGTLAPAPPPSMSAVYTPPQTVPTNVTATITARAVADPSEVFVFNFQITPAITVQISDKFATQTAGGPVTDIHAQITNDNTNAGLTWTLTANGSACSPDCGTLTTDVAPSLTAHYQPPATPPTGANAAPTITAASVANPPSKDSFNFTIGAPPIAVSIVNKFSTQAVGGPAVTLNATVTNDFGNAGLTWTLTANGSACSPDCGTLAVGTPSSSATYTPPTTLPTGSAANPTITATSAADTTKSDSFTFTIANASTALNGKYAFLVRGFNMAGTSPLAIAGAFIADGAGGISNAEFDLNNGGGFVSFPAPMTGTYVVDSTFNGIARVTITFASTPVNLVLKCTVSSDGKRGQVIQMDDSGFLTSGTLLQQVPAALAADPGGNYAFGVDSDAPVGQRIVEAGQFVMGAGGTSITGGLADAIQFAGANPIAGGINGGAAISPGTATAPDSFGRGTLTLNVGGTGDVQYSYYVTDGQQMNLLEIDGGAVFGSVFSGTAQKQKTLDSNTINSTGVLALTGMNVVGGSTVVPQTAIGVLTISGTSLTVTYDRNSGTSVGTKIPATGMIPGTIPSAAFDPNTGRVVLQNAIVFGSALYYYDTGKAYAIDISPNSVSAAFSGQLVPQAAGPFSASTHLAGNLIGRAGGSSTAGPPNVDFAATFDGTANYSFKMDLTTTNTSVGSSGQVVDLSTGDIFAIDDPTIGHGKFKLLGGVLGDPNVSAGDVVSFYLIGPNQFVAIGNTAGVPSGVLYFDPQ